MPANEGLTDDEITEIRTAAQQLITVEGSGVVGYLQQGELLSKMADVTDGLPAAVAVALQKRLYDEEAGLTANGESKFPGESQRSNLRATHRAWVVQAGLDYEEILNHPDYPRPMSLRSVRNFSALRSLNGAVTANNKGKILAFLHSYPWKVISKVATHIQAETAEQTIDSFRGRTDEEIIVWGETLSGRPQSEIKSFRLPAATYDSYVETTVPRISAIISRIAPTRTATWPATAEGTEAEANDVSRAVTFEAVMEVVALLDDEWLEGAIRDAYGAHDEDTYDRWVVRAPSLAHDLN